MKRWLNVTSGSDRNRKQGSSRGTARRARRGLGIESLETRCLMSRQAVLDFGGETVSAAEWSDGGWGTRSSQAFSAFSALFTSARTWLDLDGSGTVDAADANQAISRIVAKVRQDFAPYDLSIVVADFNGNGVLTNSQVGDAAVLVVGNATNTVTNQSATGLTPITDIGNESDELCFAMPGVVIDGSTVNSNADRFINRVARTISHELGHSFGLGHFQTDTDGNVTDALTHHIMGDGAVGLDFTLDLNFQDITYQGDIFSFANSTSQNFPELNTETQNAHAILSRPDVLGPSKSPWMAVLKPGELTIRGNDAANTISISQTGDEWTVQLNTLYSSQFMGNPMYLLLQSTTVVDAQNPDINSLNPFDAPLSRAIVFGLGGNDIISMATEMTAQLVAHGGSGDDTITGGAGVDFLYGNNGRDNLYGGANSDYLFGGAQVDELFGQEGNDHLFGGDMYWDDLVVDRLNGGPGRDTFYQHLPSPWAPSVQDNAEDLNFTEDLLVFYI